MSLGEDDPLERCSDQLIKLGERAFEALLKNQLYFSQDDQTSDSTDFLQLPFLSRELSVSKIRPRPCYAFTHKTFQEYFAACYLAQQIITGNKGKAESLLAQLSPIDKWQVWEFLIPMVSSKSSKMAVFVVSRLCSFFCQERPRTTIDAIAESDASEDLEICERKTGVWTSFTEQRWSDNEKVLDDVVTKALHVIKECEDGENRLKDNQRKMVHVLSYCFPVKKLSLVQINDYNSVYSEYLKTNCSLTDLSLNNDEFDEVVLSTIEAALLRKQNLKHFNLEIMNLTYSSLKLMSLPYVRAINWDSGFSRSYVNSAIANVTPRMEWIKNVGSEALAKCLQSYRLLTHLKFKGVFLCCKGAAALAEVIRTSPSLTH